MKKEFLFVAFILSCTFFFLLFINLFFMQGMPHAPDDTAYIFMARMFAKGKIIDQIPFPAVYVDFFPGILSTQQGTWLFQYPFGHPMLLAIGILFGFVNIIPPLVGTIFVFFLFLTAKTLYGKTTAFFVILFPLLSPFFLENAASFMSHNTASLYLIIALYFFILAIQQKRARFFIFSGIFMGLLFNTRPLTAFCFGLLFFIAQLFLIKGSLSKRFSSSIYFLVGILPLVFLFFVYYMITTHQTFTIQYYSVNQELFSSENQPFLTYIVKRINNTVVLFKNLSSMLLNESGIIAFSLILLPFIFRRFSRWDIFFLLALCALPIGYFFYNGTFLFYGPRFWYEILPFFFLLAARGYTLFFSVFPKPAIVFFIIFSAISVTRLLGFIPTQDVDTYSPQSLQRLSSFNYVDNRIEQMLKKHKITNAVIFIAPCPGNHWWCYGSVFWKNTPSLNTNIVYFKEVKDKPIDIIKSRYKDKPFYLIDYTNQTITKI